MEEDARVELGRALERVSEALVSLSILTDREEPAPPALPSAGPEEEDPFEELRDEIRTRLGGGWD